MTDDVTTEPAEQLDRALDEPTEVVASLVPMDGLGPRGWPKHLHRHSDDPEEA